MSYIEKSIQIYVPVKAASNKLNEFEDFPRFIVGVKEVQQIDDTLLHWKAEIGGQEKEWNAEITEQIPDQRIAWTSVGGAWAGGTVTFDPVSDATSEVKLRLEYEPQGLLENIGDATGFVSRRVEGDLERFKEYIERRGQETGAWRGTIKGH